MRKNSFSNTVIILALFIFLVSCNPTTPLVSPTLAAIPINENPTSTEAALFTQTATPVPTPTLAPTPTSEPMDCTIAFDSDREGNWEIFSMAPDGSEVVNLSSNPADDIRPSWSPDGTQIAFVSNRATGQNGGQFIYLMDSDGSDARQLTKEPDSNWPDWSHDGRQILYTHQGDIYLIDATGGSDSINLTKSPAFDEQPLWSPDDRLILWQSIENNNRNVFVMRSDGSEVKAITDNGTVYGATWTNDGRILTGWGWKDQQEFCGNCLVNSDGTNITNAGGKGEVEPLRMQIWDPNGIKGTLITGQIFTGDEEIYMVSPELPDLEGMGIGFRNITNHPATDRYPDWPVNCTLSRPNAPLETESEGIVLGYAGDDPSQQQRRQHFEKACAELNIQCVKGSLAELMKQGVSGIVLTSVNGALSESTQELQNAVNLGIPVFLMDAVLDMEGVYSVTIDQHEWAMISLDWLMSKTGGTGTLVYFDAYPDYHHSEIFEKYFSQYPGTTVVAGFEPGQKIDIGWVKPRTGDFAEQMPDLKAVWTNSNFEGALQGIADESGLQFDQWPVLPCEATDHGLSVWEWTRQKHPGFDCIAVGNPPGIAHDATYAAYYLASGLHINQAALGGYYGRSLTVEIPIVTSDNLDEWLENNRSVDQVMQPDEIKQKWFVD